MYEPVKWPVVGLLLAIAACARSHRADDYDAGLPPQSDLAVEVAAAGDSAWDDAKLATAPDTTCLLEEFRIVYADAAFFSRACPDDWGCLGWRAVVVKDDRGRRERMFVPIAYLSPLLPAGNVTHTALHEYCHALGVCNGRWGGWYDAGHTDAAVWADRAHSRFWSVEQRAQRMLDDEPEPLVLEPVRSPK